MILDMGLVSPRVICHTRVFLDISKSFNDALYNQIYSVELGNVQNPNFYQIAKISWLLYFYCVGYAVKYKQELNLYVARVLLSFMKEKQSEIYFCFLESGKH